MGKRYFTGTRVRIKETSRASYGTDVDDREYEVAHLDYRSDGQWWHWLRPVRLPSSGDVVQAVGDDLEWAAR